MKNKKIENEIRNGGEIIIRKYTEDGTLSYISNTKEGWERKLVKTEHKPGYRLLTYVTEEKYKNTFATFEVVTKNGWDYTFSDKPKDNDVLVDDNGNVIFYRNDNGTEFHYIYKWNKLMRYIMSNGYEEEYFYDEYERLVEKRITSSSEDRTISYHYDDKGNRYHLYEGEEGLLFFKEDRDEKTIFVKDLNENIYLTKNSYSDDGKILSTCSSIDINYVYSYNENGDLDEIQNGSGKTISKFFYEYY